MGNDGALDKGVEAEIEFPFKVKLELRRDEELDINDEEKEEFRMSPIFLV